MPAVFYTYTLNVMDICESPRRAVCQTVTFMAGTHYPCSRAVHGREHGPWTRASFFGHLRYTGDQHGLQTWVSFFDTSYNNNNNNPICKAPECQKTSVALKTSVHGP